MKIPHVLQETEDTRLLYRLNAKVKTVVLLTFAVCAATLSADVQFPYLVMFIIAISLTRSAGLTLTYTVSRAGAVLLFTACAGAMLPFASGWSVFGSLLLRALLAFLPLLVLTATTPFPQLLVALRELGLPSFLTSLLAVTHRYLFVLTGEAGRMIRARDARGFEGTVITQAGSAGALLGPLFLRSYERAERVAGAMSSRGFEGEMPATAPQPLTRNDRLFLFFGLLTAILTRTAV